MQPRNLFSTLLLASAAAAQLLTQGNGNLPACGRACSVLTQAQSSCNGGSSSSLTAWSCFCQTVWKASDGALTTMCATSCSNPTDNTAIETWYTANCGSDNGASEHGGSNTNTGGSPGSSNAASSSAAASNLPSTTATSGSYVDGTNNQDCADWWSCHWKWIVMVIVIAIGLLILGFGGRWLKRRHDRKQDRMSAGFNAGVSTRAPPMASHAADDSGRDSPSRTRDAFMPYGYAYTRSESRLAGHSPLARGTTPVNDLEKSTGGVSEAETPEDPRKRRVRARERLMGEKR